jgi:hypothetical protein
VEVLIAILALVLLVVVILVVSAPLRDAWGSSETGAGAGAAEGEGRVEQGDGRAEAGEDRLERAKPRESIGDHRGAEQRDELEVEREAKYREIRDTELDYRTGKLSQEDFAATDGALRAEAVEILNRLAALDGEPEG